ncbi:uncharacterized protein LOC141588651 [Silene latifolia]|uniref:uncharacterized protein LOC141588651 n=1 Tax=Silene latifolia TaxID=37657 RepID=UPI003D7830AD
MLMDDDYFCDQIGPSAHNSFGNVEKDDQFVSIGGGNYLDEEETDKEAEDANEDLDAINYDDDNSDEDVEQGAPVTNFTHIGELDDSQIDNWRTWTTMLSYKPGDEFLVGQEFSTKMTLTDAIASYSIQRNHQYKVADSRPHTVTFKCGRKPVGCTWHLRASKKSTHADVFTIVTYKGPHSNTCLSDIIPKDHVNLHSKIVSRHIRNLVEADSSIRVQGIIEVILQQFNYTISYKKAWMAKQRAIAEIFGDWEESFQLLPKFMQALKEANPGTIVHFTNQKTTTAGVEIFQRVFWAFGPSIVGFNHCRPIITIDGTHLYGKYKGTLLIGMGTDANNQLFPLAFAIVEGENGSSWSWFMACIRRFVTQRMGICVISDRHPGIMKAMSEPNSGWEEPYAYHRLCIRHLVSNVNTQFKSKELKNQCGWTAEQHQDKKFIRGFNKIGEINIEARRYLSEIPQCKWSICHDGGLRYGIKTTNLAEVFNNVMKGARFLPITALVKLSFYRVNAYFVERRGWARKRQQEGHSYAERITKILDRNIEKSVHHKVTIFHHEDGVYQVRTGKGDRGQGKGSHTQTVNFSQRTCTCKKLQIYKYPCSHILSVCRAYSLSWSQFVDSFFSSEEYLNSYSARFHPIPDEDNWAPYNGPTIIVDEGQRRGRGRPRSKRLKNEMDDTVRGKVTCSICRNIGHNRKTCALRSRTTTE